MRVRREKDFVTFFNENTGDYIRTGIIKDGRDSGEDPFMTSFPELLDIGIMGHCKHGKSGFCVKAGVECYQDGLHSESPNMKLEDFRSIVSQCRGRTYQFALGGCGDPDQHEHFEEILEICRQNKIVPNFTTSGLGMTKETAKLCKKYCGAAAVSWYRSEYTLRAIKLLLDAGVKTNIHYVLSRDTISEAILRLKNHTFPEGINAIIFLLHKPVGLGTAEKVVTKDNNEFKKFIQCINSDDTGYKIGLDSCTVPALVWDSGTVSLDSLDTCEGARWSAYITSDMQMLPCSFDNQERRWAVDLRRHSIKEAWESAEFQDFRSRLQLSCPECEKRNLCMGGCPLRPEIVLCESINRSVP